MTWPPSKLFSGQRQLIIIRDLANKLFSLEEYPYKDCFTIGQQVLQLHNQIPSVELWNLESIHSTINQVAYYKDAGNFKSPRDFDA